jgi:predicted outer membrane protein
MPPKEPSTFSRNDDYTFVFFFGYRCGKRSSSNTDDITFLEDKKQATMATIEAIRMAKFVKSKKRCVAGYRRSTKSKRW